MLRVEAFYEPGYFDLVHSHYWLSGQVGSLVAERWGVPLVHSMHTMAKVKNLALAAGDRPEPSARVIGEEQVVELADQLVANTPAEAHQLATLYAAAAGEDRHGVSPASTSTSSPRARRPRLANGWAWRRTPWCCCSSGGSSR